MGFELLWQEFLFPWTYPFLLVGYFFVQRVYPRQAADARPSFASGYFLLFEIYVRTIVREAMITESPAGLHNCIRKSSILVYQVACIHCTFQQARILSSTSNLPADLCTCTCSKHAVRFIYIRSLVPSSDCCRTNMVEKLTMNGMWTYLRLVVSRCW